MENKSEKNPSSNKALVILEKSEDGYWVSVDGLKGCYSFGNKIESALNNVREAITEHISDLTETGEKVPDIFLGEYEFLVKYDLQTLFETFKILNKSAFAEFAGINPSLLRQYTKGIVFAGDKQKAKITEALHKLSTNLENACL